jgi:hypothetical protein
MSWPSCPSENESGLAPRAAAHLLFATSGAARRPRRQSCAVRGTGPATGACCVADALVSNYADERLQRSSACPYRWLLLR